MGKVIGLLLLLGSICRCSAGVAFPSGIVFEPVNSTDVTEENFRYYADPKNTGTELFLTSEYISKKLSLSLKVSDFVDTSSLYFRAHPTLFECLQKVNTNISESGKISIVNGYKPDGLITERNIQNLYLASGAGCDIKVDDVGGISLSMHSVADVVIQLCVPIFQKINRDIGIVVMDDRMHLHIRGAEDGEPYFSVQDGSMTDDEFKQHAWDVIDKAYDPVKFPSMCSVDPFTSGETYPDDVSSAEEAVGKVDHPVKRNDTEEFEKLVQYPARLIDFENSEHSSTWCGQTTRSCIDCRQTIHGSTLSSRCSDRTMTARLMSVLQKVQKMTSNEFTGEKLVVMEAWDEVYADAPELNGDTPEGSLHYEGRAATVRLSGGDALRLGKVASFARCSGADYVKHNGDHIFIAVQKQAGSVAKKVQFPSSQLIVVAPPNSQLPNHELPVRFQAYGDETMPLFDSDHQMDKLVSLDSPLSNFVSMQSRYLRLNPLLTRCYQAMISKENKWREGKPAINIQVLWSYLTSTQRDSMLDTEDPRYETPALGRAMQVMYDADTVDDLESFTTRRLSNLIAHQCGPIFQTPGYQIGIGLYNDSVFVDLRSSFRAWVEDEELLSEETEEEFVQDLKDRTKAALESRLIDPDDKETACKSTVKPQKQSISFDHTFPELWSTFTPVSSSDCKPMVNTEFCKDTKGHRKEEVERLWTEIKRKHLYRAEHDVKNALEGCFGDCSTCEEGVYYESKIKNCNNLLHWIPFEFLEEIDKSNFYARENQEMKAYACQEHCIDSSPLFSLFAPSVEAVFRFDPKKSAKQDLYTTNENPLPVNDLMYKLYALYSKGTVKFWVEDETELLTLKNPLQILMVYNKDVTDIEINVGATVNMNSVINVLKSLTMDWSTTGCPDYSRESMPPFSVRGITNQI